MDNKQQCNCDESMRAQSLEESNLEQVAGGHSHARSPVFRARKPGGGLSSYQCEKCGVELPDAGAYFEHKRMVHGG